MSTYSAAESTVTWTTVTARYRGHRKVGKSKPLIDVAWIVKERAGANKKSLAVTVACPACGGLHHHGVGVDEEPGHRASHCLSGGYTLAWAPDEIAQPLLDDHKRCCAVTAEGTRCTRSTGTRSWLCIQHIMSISDDLTLRFDYPTRRQQAAR